ncbi:glycoside hydrolase family 2 protein [Flavobacterium sp.]|uniref:beta-mannosidase n=1 Tax=Flavobacterium sp. TaxID=239 RepID=UPI00248A6744|nr:glycoside hydrolase family 2 protein [Flavobacterium sp.]MDI1318158.1 glycoside hydrolase family 2 protein [Flavobacterium sp.]
MRNFVILLLFPLTLMSQNSQRSLNNEDWKFKQENKENWLPAKIPGTVHTDLLSNKVIEDPFFGTNEKQLQWIENENWNYKTSFTIAKSELKFKNIELELKGLDTYATVLLNGKPILEANNMFRTWKIQVKNNLIEGKNTIEIKFKSAVLKGKSEAQKLTYSLPGDEKVFTRKAQYQYGWDWGPRLVTAGIWKDVNLIFWNNLAIENVSYNQLELNDQKAILEFVTEIKVDRISTIKLKINDILETFNLKKGLNIISMNYEINNPKRWWTNGLGEAHLYPFEISLIDQKKTVSVKKLNIGLKTIELIQEKDKIGTGFYFKLNGIPVFMKGANYIPDDSFVPRVTDSIYKTRIKTAVDSNMNMLRVWGGGVYASDAFYDECDKKGILVWQDFMFACAMYPGDTDFLANVKREVIDNVTRLQNHPSLAIWCGNNENDEGWKNWGWQKQYNYSRADSTKVWNDYEKLFHQLIPKTLDSLSPKNKAIYWPSSPSIGWGKKESMSQGDSHYWGVWWGKEPFEIYKKKVGRFMSEYGFQGMPNLETLQKVVPQNDLNLTSEAIKNHQKHPTGYETINEYMARDYNVPKDFEDYNYISQLLQADGMKTAIEAHRRAKPYCMGTLYWQFNDCWPVTSWSSVDYYGHWKAFQYQVKRSYKNMLLSVNEEDDFYKVYLVNDTLQKYSDKIVLELTSLDGKLLWNASKEIYVEDNTSSIVFQIPKADFSKFDLQEVVLNVQFRDATSNYFFGKPRDLQLSKPTIQIKKIDELTYEVSSDVLAKNVYLSSEQYTFFSDNYFDVLPNLKVQIKLSNPIQKIKVKSLFDTLN